MFTGVCLSTGVPAAGGSGPRGCLLLGEGPAPGGGGCLLRGVPAPGGLVRGVWSPPGTPGYCCGQYASYWNAFLFQKYLLVSNDLFALFGP